MADELTPRALIRHVANGRVTYWATSPADRDRLDPTTDELVGIALTRKRAVIGESHVWSENYSFLSECPKKWIDLYQL